MGGAAATLPGIAGRAEEGAVLLAAIEGAAGRRPRAVFAHGEAGVGKTRQGWRARRDSNPKLLIRRQHIPIDSRGLECAGVSSSRTLVDSGSTG
jgi:hypothetical protein